MIQFNGVGVSYFGRWHALHNLSLSIERGEFVYVVGKSGAGKSTLLRLIYADILPTRGVVSIGGSDISMLKRHQIPYLRRQIGVIFQDFKLLEDRTVFDNIRMALDVFYMKRSYARERIWGMLKTLEIFEKRDALVRQLSGGEKQRVAIARALINDPSIILADEPTGNLDPDNARIITKMLKSASSSGRAVLMSTHDPMLRKEFPGREITLEAGQLMKDTRP